MEFKLGFGPMSSQIVDILASYAKEKQRPIMIIASRNQVDADGGYVMTTQKLSQQIDPLRSEYLKLCRDHCGPYFLDSEKSLSIRKAILATKKTIAADIEQGFDLIHIDTSRCDHAYEIADELINFCLRLNPNIDFEFGTEENVGVAASVEKYKTDVRFAGQYPNMQFVVAQTGSLVMEDRQIGSFDTAMVHKLVNYARAAGVKLKEHNADYLTPEQIQLRKSAGVNALNIAPQLGVIKTKTILDLAQIYGIDTVPYKNTVLSSNKWKKWYIDGSNDLKVDIAGHYCYSSPEFLSLLEQLSAHTEWTMSVQLAIIDILDTYYDCLH
jgi:tagatose-1,6-bisphosphate aldolase non-catalytic subunit AgaZ/GatZ